MVPALAAPAAPAITGTVLCAVSLAASAARPLQIKVPNMPKMPKMPTMPTMPKVQLPDIDLPNFGKKKDASAAKGKDATSATQRQQVGKVKVRAAKAVTTSNPDAPTVDELSGRVNVKTIAAGQGYQRFPSRRMPGANMDSWKEIARDIGPKI